MDLLLFLVLVGVLLVVAVRAHNRCATLEDDLWRLKHRLRALEDTSQPADRRQGGAASERRAEPLEAPGEPAADEPGTTPIELEGGEAAAGWSEPEAEVPGQGEEAERASGESAPVPADAGGSPQEQPEPESAQEQEPELEPEPASRVARLAENLRRSGAEGLSSESSSAAGSPPGDGPASAPPPEGEPEPAGPNWEARLGAKLSVWIGAIALVLAGIFMVRYFAAHGLLGPTVRVLLTGGFGLVMVGVGEWLRGVQPRIAQGLTAAAVAVLYAAVLGAVNLHGLISATAGFVLMVGVTVGAVVLSLRHGPLVALLGLVGGFAMPGLLGTHHESTAQLFGYLMLLELGLTVLTRGRRWWWLMLGTMGFAMGWVALWLLFWFEPGDSVWLGLFLLVSVVALVAATFNDSGERLSEWRVSDLMAWPAILAGLGLIAWLTGRGGFSALEWLYVALLGAGCLVLGRLRSRYLPMAALAPAMGLVLLTSWQVDAAMQGVSVAEGRFAWVTLLLGVLYGGGAYACLWGAARPTAWAWLSGGSVLGYFVLGYAWIDPALLPLPWWTIAVAGAGAYAAMSVPIVRRRERLAEGIRPAEPTTLVALILTSASMYLFIDAFELGRQWIAVAWSAQVPAAIWIALRLRIELLHKAAIVLGGLVTLRLVGNPAVLRYSIGEHVLLNWLPLGYGLPAAALAAGARLMTRRGDAAPVRWLAGMTGLIVFALVTLMVRHGFHPVEMDAPAFTLYEHATYSVAWFGLGLIFLYTVGRRVPGASSRAGLVLPLLGVAAALLGAGLLENPLWTEQDVGSWPVLNGLLYIYGVPAVLAAWSARFFTGSDEPNERTTALVLRFSAMLLALGLVTLEVRHAFHPGAMDTGAVTLYEHATYSVAWLALGLGVLLGALRWAPEAARQIGPILPLLGVAAALLGAGLLENPLWSHHSIGGWPVFNGLLYIYGVPAVLAAWAGLALEGSRDPNHRTVGLILRLSALVLTLGLISLEVRQAFHGPFLDAADVSNAEWYAYSAAWIVFAAALLIRGVRRDRAVLRYAALAVMLISVIKVFVFDTQHLQDLWRVLSFLGLGVSLLALSWIYQRFVLSPPSGGHHPAST